MKQDDMEKEKKKCFEKYLDEKYPDKVKEEYVN